MTLLVPTVGEADSLAYFVNKSRPEDLVLCLFTNDIEPSAKDTAASYEEASGHGYERIRLNGSDWKIAAPAEARHAEQTFTFSGPLGEVYGYFLKRATSGRIAWAERFDEPQTIKNNGDQIKITPTIAVGPDTP